MVSNHTHYALTSPTLLPCTAQRPCSVGWGRANHGPLTDGKMGCSNIRSKWQNQHSDLDVRVDLLVPSHSMLHHKDPEISTACSLTGVIKHIP